MKTTRDDYNQVLRITPNDANDYARHGYVKYKLGQYEAGDSGL